MAIKDILFHMRPSEAGESTTEFASSLAAITGSHLTAAGVALESLPPIDVQDSASFTLLREYSAKLRDDAEKAYLRFAAAVPPGVQTDLVVIQAYSQTAGEQFSELARHFDLSVVGQCLPESTEEDQLVLTGALFGSGKPVFIVPRNRKGPTKLTKAMVCWDGGIPAARALAGALPLLSRAGCVEVVRLNREREQIDDFPGFNITRHLARHGINATLRTLPPADDVGGAIQSHADDSGADYLVLGAYGHWRLRELIFGGTTRTILASMKVPVFMSH